MSISDSLFVSLFCMVLVFLVLAVLAVLITLFSRVLRNFRIKASKDSTENSVKDEKPAAQAVPVLHASNDINANAASVGELKLIRVDEKTAAMIMAIVSYESGIPLSELSFRSIRAVEKS